MARWLASWAALEQPEQEYMRGWSVMASGQPARHDKECPAATGGGVFLILHPPRAGNDNHRDLKEKRGSEGPETGGGCCHG
jgi:hypothetical protein